MGAAQTMKWMGRSARSRTGSMGHSMKDRALEKRLERVSDEADRLRFENDLLRDKVAETRSEHGRILEALEARLSAPEPEPRRSHRGRWLLAIMAVGGAVYTWLRVRGQDDGDGRWLGQAPAPAVTESGTATAI